MKRHYPTILLLMLGLGGNALAASPDATSPDATSLEAFMKRYLHAAEAIYSTRQIPATGAAFKALIRDSNAVKSKWLDARASRLDNLFIHSNAGLAYQLETTELSPAKAGVNVHFQLTAADLVKAEAVEASNHGRYELVWKNGVWKIIGFSELKGDTAPNTITVTTPPNPSGGSLAQADAASPDTDATAPATAGDPQSVVEQYLQALQQTLPAAADRGPQVMALLSPAVKATSRFWVNDRVARRGQARSVSTVLMFAPTSWQLKLSEQTGDLAAIEFHYSVGNSDWNRLKGDASTRQAVFKLIRKNGNWYLADFEGA